MRIPLPRFALLALLPALLAPAGCGGGGGSGEPTGGASATSPIGYDLPMKAGKYEILGILTDNKSSDKAKENAVDALTLHPDMACMVGLWAYNPPQIVNALNDAGKKGKVKVVGFDENDSTLQGISEGYIEGTIVQQPFAFGYKSVEYLAALARGEEVVVPANKMVYIPHDTITKDNVAEYQLKMENIKAGVGEPPAKDRDDYDTSQEVQVAFVTNSEDPFWRIAEQGCILGTRDFNAKCYFLAPPNGSVQEQKEYIEDLITKDYQGLAISPIDPKNQGAIIDKACEHMPVICQDSDAPNTNRRFYLGTSNYLAGRAAGKLVKQAIPDGGKVMIFVGKLEVLNAQERSRGLIEELLDKPLPPEFAAYAE